MRSLGGGAPEVVGESRGHSSWTTLWWVKGGSETEIVHIKGEVCTKGGLLGCFFSSGVFSLGERRCSRLGWFGLGMKAGSSLTCGLTRACQVERRDGDPEKGGIHTVDNFPKKTFMVLHMATFHPCASIELLTTELINTEIRMKGSKGGCFDIAIN